MLLDRPRVQTKETLNLVTQTSPVTSQKSSCGVMEGARSLHRTERGRDRGRRGILFCFKGPMIGDQESLLCSFK